MITLITGAPGAGKSAALVQLLDELAKGRTLYVDGIPDLKVPHEKLEDPRRWPEVVPDGAAIVIDEVQRVWRPRGPGQKVPSDISALETHRHRGLDFFIVTQAPRLVDANVRALVGRHVHLRDLGLLGRWWYEWPECSESVAWKSAPIKRRYRLPKAIFDKYRSASMHVKPIRSVPWMLFVAAGAVVGVGVLGWITYRTISTKMGPGEVPAKDAPPAGFVPRLVNAPARTPSEIAAGFVPRFAHDPGSAPAYDDLRKVVAVPRNVGGYCVGDRCTCYSQQGTVLEIPALLCREALIRPRFNPYRADPVVEVASRDQRVSVDQ